MEDLDTQEKRINQHPFQILVLRTAKEIGLYLNADKTEFICFNQDVSEGTKSLNGEKSKQVEDFKYLGSYIASTKHDVNIRLGKAWDALD